MPACAQSGHLLSDSPDEARVTPVRVSLRVPHALLERDVADLDEFVESVERAGIDGVCVGDHVSFRDGTGYDGLIHATALAVASHRLDVWTAVYLLALRHPVAVARQVASLANLAPGRFVFGVGVGGDDRHELEVCGIDPRRRGRRFDASLDIVRALLCGEEVTFDDGDLRIPGAALRPAPSPRVPIMVGGRSETALRRAARAGDGWLALWMSPARVAAAIAMIAEYADQLGRTSPPDRHGLVVWCGFGASVATARTAVADAMERLYKQPFVNFERYVPCGTPRQVAAELAPYVEAGVRELLVIGVADDEGSLVEQVAELRELLR
jgi:alkanesulfonate monooxygenase SsuD/methylene tetrahydromethanopterin reductase-like flavin-dependent oxidoreductase (luciferase family)